MKKLIITSLVLGVVALGYLFSPLEPTYEADYGEMSTSESQTNSNRELISYETEVESGEECSSFEQYDAEARVCYFECATEAECTEIQNSIDDELATWADEESADQSPMNEGDGGDVDTLASYSVSAGESISLRSGTETKDYKKLWGEIAELSPNTISDKYIETYEVYDDAQSDTLAFVDDADQNGKWRIVVNLAGRRDSSQREQKATLIHELAHIITLNTSQVKPDFTTCSTYELSEGCSFKESYINMFYTTYWKGVTPPAKYSAEKFVTEYAASEPVEDLAETFAFFVLERDKDKLGNQMKDQKIRLLYNYPELVQMRKDMREVLARDIVRARKV
jgi:hypothetical protein